MSSVLRTVTTAALLLGSSTALAEVGTPLTNGKGVAIVSGSPVIMYTQDNELKLDRSGTVTTIASPSHGATMASNGSNLLVVYIQGTDVKAITSTNGGASWSSATTLATGQEGKTPGACVWSSRGQLYGMAVWSDGPINGYAVLNAVPLSRGRWGSVTQVDTDNPGDEDSNAPGLACTSNQVQVYWRQGTVESGIELADIRKATYTPNIGRWSSPSTVVTDAYDPSVCRSGTTVMLGYHSRQTAYLAISNNSGSSFGSPSTLDSTGRFVNVDCDGTYAAVSWADYDAPTIATDDARRRLGFAYTTNSGSTWTTARPAGEDTYQILGSVDADSSTRKVAVVWTDSWLDAIESDVLP